MIDRDGLYLYCGVGEKVLGIIRENQCSFIWMRNFFTPADAARGLRDDGILSPEKAAEALSTTVAGLSYFTTDFIKTKEGFGPYFKRYDLFI